MRQNAIDAIDAVEPYKGGNGHTLWRIHRLDIIDKHRLLLTARSALRFHSIPPSRRKIIEESWHGSYGSEAMPLLQDVFIAPAIPRLSLKAGDILLTLPESEVEEEMKLHLDVAFSEPQIVDG